MSTSVFVSASGTPPSISEEQLLHQQSTYDKLLYETNDDDISLARYMTHKMQLHQPMTVISPWTSPQLLAFQKDHQLECLSAYTQYHQFQPQYMYGYKGKHSDYQQRHQQQYPSGTKGQSYVKKTRSIQDRKTKLSSSHHRTQSPAIDRSVSLKTHSSKKERPHLSSPSSQSSLSSQSERTSKHFRSQQRHYQSNSPVPSLLDDSGTRRSSIQSHTSAASSSIKTTSDTTSLTNNGSLYSSSHSIFSMSENKLSLSKRIRGVLSGGSKQQQPSSSVLPLQRSPSMVSCTSATTSSMANGSSRSSWSNLFRKSSKSRQVTPTSTNQKKSSMQKVMLLDSPTSSISETSFRHGITTDLPSPASSTSSPVSSSSETSKEISGEQDYFGLIASQPSCAQRFLQHGSPTLSPKNSTHSKDIHTAGSLLESASLPADGPIHSHGKRVRTTTTTATMTTAPAITGNKNTRIRFTTTLLIHDTFSSKEYDRKCDTQVTCQRLTPVLALQIKQELNDYKLGEMAVHPSSRQHTQFFL